MKVLHYIKESRTSNVHNSVYSVCFFIPDKSIILYKKQEGTICKENYYITKRKKDLKEASQILEGQLKEEKGYCIFNVKEFEYDSGKLEEIVKSANSKEKLEKKLKSYFEDMLKHL